MDKDWAQINATQQTWPTTKVQLCYWHLQRAVKKKDLLTAQSTQIFMMPNMLTEK